MDFGREKQGGRYNHHQFPKNNKRDGKHGGGGSGAGGGGFTNKDVAAKDIPPEGKVVHPLHNRWKFWYFEPQKNVAWEKNLKEVKEISTVEEFWAVYDNIKLPSEIGPGCSYFFFKVHLKPMWEDEGNKNGGRWLVTFNKQKKELSADEKWLEVLLCLIGEAFGYEGEDICGAVVDVRPKFDKISIWTKDCNNKDRIMKIGRIIKERLHLHDNTMNFERHVDTANKVSSRPTHLFSL